MAISAASIAGLARAGYAAAPERFALFSDTHINADRKRKSGGINMADHLGQVVDEILRLPQPPLGVFVNGDLAQSTGQTGDYETFIALLNPLAKRRLPIHLTLGNHDQRERFWQATPWGARSARPVHDRQVGTVLSGKANWFLLDSLRQTNETPGELGVEQIAWLDAMLAAHADKPALVLGHHNISGNQAFKDEAEVVVPTTDRRLTPAGVKDSDRLLEVLTRRPHVQAYICGHTHQWNILRWRRVPFVNLPVVAYKFLPKDPAGWVLCDLTPDGIELELRSLDPGYERHGQRVTLPWRQA